MINLVDRFKYTTYLTDGKQLKFYGRTMDDCSREELYTVIGFILNNPFVVDDFMFIQKKQERMA